MVENMLAASQRIVRRMYVARCTVRRLTLIAYIGMGKLQCRCRRMGRETTERAAESMSSAKYHS